MTRTRDTVICTPGMSSEIEDTWHWQGHSWTSDWSQLSILASDWLAGITGQCNVLSKHVTTKISPVCLGVHLNKMIGAESNGRCHNVWDSTFPLHSIIAPWDTICMRAPGQFPYRHRRVEAAPGTVLWLHLNAVISLYAAHYKRQVWSTLTLLFQNILEVLLLNYIYFIHFH